MSFLQTLFFESRLYLGILTFFVFATVLLLRPRMESETFRKRSLPITMLIIIGMFVMQPLITTDREALLARLEVFVNAIVEPNPSVLNDAISSRYDAEELDKAGLLESLGRWMERYDVYDVRYRKRAVTFNGLQAQLELGVMATVQIDKSAGQSHFGTWLIDWEFDNDRWRITAIRPVMIDGIEIQNMRPYLR